MSCWADIVPDMTRVPIKAIENMIYLIFDGFVEKYNIDF